MTDDRVDRPRRRERPREPADAHFRRLAGEPPTPPEDDGASADPR